MERSEVKEVYKERVVFSQVSIVLAAIGSTVKCLP